MNTDVFKANDNYLRNFLKRKFNCNIIASPSNHKNLFYPSFIIDEEAFVCKDNMTDKREAIYVAASIFIKKLLDEDKISERVYNYYDDIFHKLFNGRICYS